MRKGGLIGASLIFAEIVKPVGLTSILLGGWLLNLLSLSTHNPGPTKKARFQYTGLQNLPTNIPYSDNLTSGLAAMAIGLGKETSNHTAELITPILTCLTGAPKNYNNWQETKIIYNLLLTDADSRVRYYACESLYNVVKVLHNLNCITLDLLIKIWLIPDLHSEFSDFQNMSVFSNFSAWNHIVCHRYR